MMIMMQHKTFCIGYTQMYNRNFVDCYKVPDIINTRVERAESVIKELRSTVHKKKLEEIEHKLRLARSDIVDIEYMDVGRKADLA